jgi:hypothetical protein
VSEDLFELVFRNTNRRLHVSIIHPSWNLAPPLRESFRSS